MHRARCQSSGSGSKSVMRGAWHPIRWRATGRPRSDGRMEIREVDVHDDATTRAFHDVEQAAARHDRPHALLRTYDALLSSWRNPSDYHRPRPLVAEIGRASCRERG